LQLLASSNIPGGGRKAGRECCVGPGAPDGGAPNSGKSRAGALGTCAIGQSCAVVVNPRLTGWGLRGSSAFNSRGGGIGGAAGTTRASGTTMAGAGSGVASGAGGAVIASLTMVSSVGRCAARNPRSSREGRGLTAARTDSRAGGGS
jgi:hypothetical protein